MSIIKACGIEKSFSGIQALNGVDFEVGDNEVVGLLGDNGAGKSTLIKILSGVHRPDSGEIYIKGQKINTRKYSVKKAREYGIETVYQEKALGEKQSIWRNIFIGRHLTTRLGFIKLKETRKEADKIIRDFMGLTGGGASPENAVGKLSGGERQGIAIGRAMYFDADLVILDEPTMALSLQEVTKVLKFISKIKDSGRSCLYISHNISNVYPVSDRFVALDRGKIIAEYKKSDLTLEELNKKLIEATKADIKK